jgi:hypothetical protein
MNRTALISAAALALAACGTRSNPPLLPSPQFEQQLKSIASTYETYGRVDDEMRWAPYLCRMPMPGNARYSEGDPASHGMKLYSVFAAKREEYIHPPQGALSVGQVVVKESWHLEEIDPATKLPENGYTQPTTPLSDAQKVDAQRIQSGFYPYATKDGHTYRATDRAGLYVMTRLDAATEGTDEGWVYGTLTMGGEVTAAGRVESCMNCHVAAATHERLFGIEYDGL